MESKKKICKKCGELDYWFSKKRCKLCAQKDYAKKSLEKKLSAPLPNISKQTDKNKEAKKEKRELLNPFFEYHIAQIAKNPYCQNCGIKIEASHFHVAHILPKAKYVSIMNNLDNALYLCTSVLGGNGCHEDYDRLQNNSDGIKQVLNQECIELLLSKFSKFKTLCKEKGKAYFAIEELGAGPVEK
jgi:hypothetical protein